MPLVHRVARNFSFLLFGQVASQAFVFFALIYLTRVLQPTAFGKLGFAQSVLAYFLLASDMGIALLGAREIAAGKYQASYLGNLISLRACLGVLSFVVLCLAALSLASLRETGLLVILFGLTIIPYSLTLDWVFLGLEIMNGVGVVNVTRGLVYFMLLLLFVRNPNSLLLVPLFFLGAHATSAYLSWSLAKRWTTEQALAFTLPSREWGSVLSCSAPLFLYAVLASSQLNLAAVLLGWLRSPSDVGIYVAAYKLVYIFIYLAYLYSFSILPILSSSREGSQLTLASAKGGAVCGLLLAVVMTLCAAPLVTLLYGVAYRPAVDIVRLLVWSLPVMACVAVLSMDLVARGRARPLLVALGMGLVAEFGLDLLLIPRYGPRGAALAYMANTIVTLGYLGMDVARAQRVGRDLI